MHQAMKNLSRSGRKTVLEGGNDIRIQPIKTRLEVEELLSKLERNHQFTREMGQQWNDWVKDVFSDIDERTQINDATFHETMATAQAFGINKDNSFFFNSFRLVFTRMTMMNQAVAWLQPDRREQCSWRTDRST